MTQKKLGKWLIIFGCKSGFGIGFDISKYGISLELGLWFVGIEF